MDQPGKVANPARGQLNREENEYFPVRVRAWEFGLARRVRQSRPASACPSSYSGGIWCYLVLRDSPRVPRRRRFIYFKPPYMCAIGSVPSLSGHAIAYWWRSLPKVRRHRARKPQCNSERVLMPWQVPMDQLIYASLSHTHYWLWSGHVGSTGDYSTLVLLRYFFRRENNRSIGEKRVYHWGSWLSDMLDWVVVEWCLSGGWDPIGWKWSHTLARTSHTHAIHNTLQCNY